MNEEPLPQLLGTFLEYVTPSDEDYRSVLASGMVVLDTNVLLNLYRYYPLPREDLFRIIEALGNRLFLPDQVATEFWSNRESTIRDSTEQADVLKRDLGKHLDGSLEAITAWASRVGLPAQMKDELAVSLRRSYDDLRSRVDTFDAEGVGTTTLDTNMDPVLQRLARLLEGSMGAPLGVEEYEVALQEAERRSNERVPPGYADANKQEPFRYGDYLMWKQVLDEAKARQVDVLIVTGDFKDDWWRREKGETRGPRLELSRELARFAGVRLFMLRPANLLSRAVAALGISIAEESVEAAERVDRLVAERRVSRPEAGRFLIEKLPDGRGDSYLETVIEMTSLAESSPRIDEYVESFQEHFPTITLKDVVRRRMKSLESLGITEIQDGQVRLTDLGGRLLRDRSLELLQDAFLRRIAGSPEIRELAESTSLSSLRTELRDDPPEGLSPTQASLVLRWMEQLDLV